MFSKFTVNQCDEMALGADQLLAKIQRYKWNDNSINGKGSIMWSHVILLYIDQLPQPKVDPTAVTLVPMAIHTLICEIAYMS